MNAMKIAMMSVINSGNFKLLDVQEKIKKLWITGDYTEDEKNELMEAALAAANPDAERPENQKMLESLAKRITALETKMAKLEAGDFADPDEGETAAIPAWKPWDGISKDYAYGAKVAHKGKIWISDFQGQNTWEPGVVGTENLWIEWADEAA